MDAAAFQAGLAWRQQGEQKKERAKAEATETQSLRKLMSIYDPENKDQYTSMGLGDLRGSAQAIAIKQHMDELQRKEEERAYSNQQRAAGVRFQQQLAPDHVDDAVDPVNPPPLTPQRIMAAAAETGYQLDPRTIAQFAKEGEGMDWNDVMPRPFQIDGVKGAVGKSGQFQFLPTQTGDSMQAIPVLDGEGNVLGYRVPTGKGGSAPAPTKQSKTLPDSYNARLNTLMEQIDASESVVNKPDDELKALYKGQDLAKVRAAKTKEVERNRKALRDHVERFRQQGYGDEDFWQGETDRLGLATPAAPSAAAGNYPKATNPKTGETLYFKDGKWQK